jgi:hypothetical protein
MHRSVYCPKVYNYLVLNELQLAPQWRVAVPGYDSCMLIAETGSIAFRSTID